MATTTPNFGWPVPTSTDLVKDGATAMEALGDAIDTSMVDLKGGTTGQILSKASSADMDFSWTTPNPGDITGVTAGTGISGGGTSGDVTITNSMATTITTKGDLVPGTGSGTFARLAAGSNGETLVADSSTSTGLRYQSAYNGNAIINGAFDVWQRGTSIAFGGTNKYSADRWMLVRSGYAAGATISRQTGNGNTQYAARVQRDSGNTDTGYIAIQNGLETSDSMRFAGKAVTVSFSARVGANYSATSNNLLVSLYSGTGTDQNLQSYTGGAIVGATQVYNPTTSWQRFQYTVTVPSTATELALFVQYFPTGTAGANDWFEITEVQLELGSIATTFKRAGGGTIQGELAACQRYYVRLGAGLGNANQRFGAGPGVNSTLCSATFDLPVEMRVQVSSIDYSTLQLYDGNNIYAITSASLNAASTLKPNVNLSVASGLTSVRYYEVLANNNTAAYIGFSAEL